MDILVLADTYNQFAYFIQTYKSDTMKLFTNGQSIVEDNDGNKYYFCSIYADSMHGRCFDKIIDIRLLSIDTVRRLRNVVGAEIEFGGMAFSYGKRKQIGRYKMLKIKDNVELKELEKFGYSPNCNGSCWYKYVTSRRRISIWSYNRSIEDDVVDSTTYSGFKYEGEYRHQVKKYIQDLIQAGLVEKVENKNG